MFLLHSLQSPINIGMILRTAEVFGQGVTIYDPHDVMRGDNLNVVADFGCGSLGRRPPFVSADLGICLAKVQGRLIAATLDGNAKPLGSFEWRQDDCVVLGNEYDGLSSEFSSSADQRVWVPVPPGYLPKPTSISPIDPSRVEPVRNNGSVSLNVAATAAIIGYSIFATQAAMPL
jgi:tRNA G18 (ribose-2'-O)-methylase SpoU